MTRCQSPLIAELLAVATLLRQQANELLKTARELEQRAADQKKEIRQNEIARDPCDAISARHGTG